MTSRSSGGGFGREGRPAEVQIRKPSDSIRVDATTQDLESRAFTLHRNGFLKEAESLYGALIAVGTKNSLVYTRLGIILLEKNQREQAVRLFNQAISVDPQDSLALHNLGTALKDKGQIEQAIAVLKNAIAVEPTRSLSWCNLANCLAELGRYQEAYDCYEKAISADPRSPVTFLNFGLTLKDSGDLERAERQLRIAVSLAPENPQAHEALGEILLLRGEFGEGWREYDWRLQKPHYLHRRMQTSMPPASLLNEHVVVIKEQGVGDEILFSSMLPDLASEAASICWHCDQRLVPLLRRSFPAVRFAAQVPVDSGKAIDSAATRAVTLYMGSLGGYYRRSTEDFARRKAGYLQSDRERTNQIRQQIRQDMLSSSPRLTIGISWKSSSRAFSAKNISLDELATALAIPRLRLVSLQYGEISREVRRLRRKSGIEVVTGHGVDPFQDLDGLASLIDACDMVVTISNATAHLAGALGKPTMVLLPAMALWRWGLQETSSLWYPTVRLFRQVRKGDWDQPLARLKAEMEQAIRTSELR